MATLERFDTPAGLPEPSEADADRWSTTVGAIFESFVTDFPQLYDPRRTDTPEDASRVTIAWQAFPARLLRKATSEEQRWRDADASRDEQDEYCEWSVERAPDERITRITFTTEIPEYWDHMADDPQRALELYREHVGPEVTLEDLFDENGSYRRRNRWNTSTTGRLSHLVQQNNSLGAAVALVAEATVQREQDGEPVITKELLARCAGLGDPFRNSDPQIASVVNGAAREGNELTLADPPGLYIDAFQSAGLRTPDGADPAEFWTIERGTETHALRARFEVPPDRDYVVGDITSGGRPIAYGAQLADRVTVRVSAIVKPADHTPLVRPCNA